MKEKAKRFLSEWGKPLVIIAALALFGTVRDWAWMAGRAVDIGRAPEIINTVDLDSKERDAVILSNVTNIAADLQNFRTETRTNIAVIKSKEARIIEFIDSQTNHAPIEWPMSFNPGQSVMVKRAPEVDNP